MKKTLSMAVVFALALFPGLLSAQEVKIDHGFLFFAGGKYTLDEKVYGIYEDGHEFSKLIAENKKALDYYNSYRTWHVTANVMFGFSLAAFAFGGVCYMPGVEKNLPDNTGIYGFAAGGGFMLLSVLFEFISWGSLGSAAETYNKGVMIDETSSLVPRLQFARLRDGGVLALNWQF